MKIILLLGVNKITCLINHTKIQTNKYVTINAEKGDIGQLTFFFLI